MTFDDLGNLAELIAAIGVIISLAYLAIQIRQNTRALRSTVFQDLQVSLQQLVTSLVNDEDVARLWRQANEDLDQLTDDERIRFFSLVMRQFSTYENVYYQHRQSMIDEEVWAGWRAGMHFFVSHPGLRRYWETMSSIYMDSFRTFVEKELLSETSEADEITAYKAGSAA